MDSAGSDTGRGGGGGVNLHHDHVKVGNKEWESAINLRSKIGSINKKMKGREHECCDVRGHQWTSDWKKKSRQKGRQNSDETENAFRTEKKSGDLKEGRSKSGKNLPRENKEKTAK